MPGEIVSCATCRAQVAFNATSCPNCGEPEFIAYSDRLKCGHCGGTGGAPETASAPAVVDEDSYTKIIRVVNTGRSRPESASRRSNAPKRNQSGPDRCGLPGSSSG